MVLGVAELPDSFGGLPDFGNAEMGHGCIRGIEPAGSVTEYVNIVLCTEEPLLQALGNLVHAYHSLYAAHFCGGKTELILYFFIHFHKRDRAAVVKERGHFAVLLFSGYCAAFLADSLLLCDFPAGMAARIECGDAAPCAFVAGDFSVYGAFLFPCLEALVALGDAAVFHGCGREEHVGTPVHHALLGFFRPPHPCAYVCGVLAADLDFRKRIYVFKGSKLII